MDIWSYVYRGPKKYSEEFANMHRLTLEEGEGKQLSLKNIVKEAVEGNYSLKVKLKTENRKTTYDKTEKIFLKVPEKAMQKEKREELLLPKESGKNNEKETVKEKIVVRKDDIIYVSSSDTIKNSIPFFILLFFVLSLFFSITNTKNIKK